MPKLIHTPLDYPQFHRLCDLLLRQERVMRWGHGILTDEELAEMKEPVLSHVGGIHVIKRLLKIMRLDELSCMDWDNVDIEISVHDLPEVKHGDKVTKTASDHAEEEQAEYDILGELGEFGWVGAAVIGAMDRYAEKNGATGAKNSAASRLVKTIDEIHGLIKMLAAGRGDFNYVDHKKGRSRDVFTIHAKADFPWLYGFGMYLVDLRTRLQEGD